MDNAPNTITTISQRIEPIIVAISAATKAIVGAQAAMKQASAMSIHIPLYGKMTKAITEMQEWRREVGRLPW